MAMKKKEMIKQLAHGPHHSNARHFLAIHILSQVNHH